MQIEEIEEKLSEIDHYIYILNNGGLDDEDVSVVDELLAERNILESQLRKLEERKGVLSDGEK